MYNKFVEICKQSICLTIISHSIKNIVIIRTKTSSIVNQQTISNRKRMFLISVRIRLCNLDS